MLLEGDMDMDDEESIASKEEEMVNNIGDMEDVEDVRGREVMVEVDNEDMDVDDEESIVDEKEEVVESECKENEERERV